MLGQARGLRCAVTAAQAAQAGTASNGKLAGTCPQAARAAKASASRCQVASGVRAGWPSPSAPLLSFSPPTPFWAPCPPTAPHQDYSLLSTIALRSVAKSASSLGPYVLARKPVRQPPYICTSGAVCPTKVSPGNNEGLNAGPQATKSCQVFYYNSTHCWGERPGGSRGSLRGLGVEKKDKDIWHGSTSCSWGSDLASGGCC